MENTENSIIISREELENYNRLKSFRRNAVDSFSAISTLLFRLNVFINLLMENDSDSYEKILFNIQSAADDLNACCREYERMLNDK